MQYHRTKRRRHGRIRLSATIGLCLAASLMVFARAGGEDTVLHLLDSLAGNADFITHAVALEFGLTPDDTAVFAPRAATASRNEDAAEPIAESTYLPAASGGSDAPVLSSSDQAATITVNNETSYDVDVAACLSAPCAARTKNGSGPQVLIVHTHGSESYTPDAAFPYSSDEPDRTTDTRYNVVRVGDELQSVLEAGGIATLHIRDIFDSPTYSGSYDRALAAIEQTLEEHPSIRVVVDVHRDSILTDDGRAYKTSCTIDGQQMAQLMLVVGTDDGGLHHPEWQQNLNYAAQLQYSLNRAYPGLMRPLNLRTQRFNQHARPGSLLIEVGSSGNTMTEALAAVRLFGQVLCDDLTGA